MGDLKTFIAEQEKLAFRHESESGDSPVVGIFRRELDHRLSGKQSREHGENSTKGIHCLVLHSDQVTSSVMFESCCS